MQQQVKSQGCRLRLKPRAPRHTARPLQCRNRRNGNARRMSIKKDWQVSQPARDLFRIWCIRRQTLSRSVALHLRPTSRNTHNCSAIAKRTRQRDERWCNEPRHERPVPRYIARSASPISCGSPDVCLTSVGVGHPVHLQWRPRGVRAHQ